MESSSTLTLVRSWLHVWREDFYGTFNIVPLECGEPQPGHRNINRTYRYSQILSTEEKLFTMGEHDLLPYLCIKEISIYLWGNPTAFPSTKLQVFVSRMICLSSPLPQPPNMQSKRRQRIEDHCLSEWKTDSQHRMEKEETMGIKSQTEESMGGVRKQQE